MVTRLNLCPQLPLQYPKSVFRSCPNELDDLTPTLESFTFGGFLSRPLNNATLMGSVRYYHRLPDFQALLDAHAGSVVAVLEDLRARARSVEDPFDLLPRGSRVD